MSGLNDRPFIRHQALNVTADTSEGSSDFDGRLLVFLTNDGPNDVTLNVEDSQTSTGLTTEATAWVMKPGESIADLPWNFRKIHYKTAGGTAALRGLVLS